MKSIYQHITTTVTDFNSYSYFLSASSIVGFRHPLPFFQHLHESEGINSGEGSLTSTEDLPHCHTIGPL